MSDYDDSFVPAAYNTVMEKFMVDGESNEVNVPFEFLAVLKEGLDRYSAQRPGQSEFSLAAVDFPFIDSLPDFIPFLTAKISPNGGYDIYSEDRELNNISYIIPSEFQRFGEFFDAEPDLENNRLPVGPLSNRSLSAAQDSVKRSFDEMTPTSDYNSLNFLQAQKRYEDEGSDEFEWRGDRYSTKPVPFGADRTRGIIQPLQEMNIPEQVREDPFGADFTGQMRPVDE
jgi:hypothetical protein